MTSVSRRRFGGLLGASAVTLAMPSIAFGAKPKVVVIGGGAGGATAARYLAKDSKGAIDVTLVEASKRYYTCFFSNLTNDCPPTANCITWFLTLNYYFTKTTIKIDLS